MTIFSSALPFYNIQFTVKITLFVFTPYNLLIWGRFYAYVYKRQRGYSKNKHRLAGVLLIFYGFVLTTKSEVRRFPDGERTVT